MFAWSQLDFSANPVSFSAVSLTGRQTWKRKGTDTRKKRHLAFFVFVPSVFGKKFPTAEFE
jgi:hypothetical protein